MAERRWEPRRMRDKAAKEKAKGRSESKEKRDSISGEVRVSGSGTERGCMIERRVAEAEKELALT